jgi:hypothetical protein
MIYLLTCQSMVEEEFGASGGDPSPMRAEGIMIMWMLRWPGLRFGDGLKLHVLMSMAV